MKFNKKLQTEIVAEVIAANNEPFIILEVYTNEYNHKCIHCLAYTCDKNNDIIKDRYKIVYCSKQHEILLSEYIKKQQLFDNLMKEDHQQYLQIPGQINYEKELVRLILDNDIKLLPNKKSLNNKLPDGKYLIPLNAEINPFLKHTQTVLAAHMSDMLEDGGIYFNFT